MYWSKEEQIKLMELYKPHQKTEINARKVRCADHVIPFSANIGTIIANSGDHMLNMWPTNETVPSQESDRVTRPDTPPSNTCTIWTLEGIRGMSVLLWFEFRSENSSGVSYNQEASKVKEPEERAAVMR
uniref:Uncharacterized protein n=1 Tax=Timema monikensis TaxID=170555 RepID=A0A7R9EJB8_9NEOP|nr:unnamed protein product [Timema monikensis]